jgi:UPF0716 family protein affecting phage T7 exclusion
VCRVVSATVAKQQALTGLAAVCTLAFAVLIVAGVRGTAWTVMLVILTAVAVIAHAVGLRLLLADRRHREQSRGLRASALHAKQQRRHWMVYARDHSVLGGV